MKTYEKLQYSLLYRWFIGYGINEEVNTEEVCCNVVYLASFVKK